MNEIIKLDANELAYPLTEMQIDFLTSKIDLTALNRYPEADASKLIKSYADFMNLPAEKVIAGNGSDEILDLIFKAFTEPKDIVVSLDPSFVMYETMSSIYKCQFRRYQPNDYYTLDVDAFIEYLDILNPRLVFICNPNNPTGALIAPDSIKKILAATDAQVVIDEAYGEFISANYEDYSVKSLIDAFPNLIVLKTLSKAYGLAGLRIGFGISCAENMEKLYACKYPYNISRLSQAIGVLLMTPEFKEISEKNRLKIIADRGTLTTALKAYEFLKVYESNSNFVWFKVDGKTLSNEVFFNTLYNSGIKIRQFSQSYFKDYFRVTVGTESENKILLKCIDEMTSVGDTMLRKAVGQ